MFCICSLQSAGLLCSPLSKILHLGVVVCSTWKGSLPSGLFYLPCSFYPVNTGKGK